MKIAGLRLEQGGGTNRSDLADAVFRILEPAAD